MNSFHDHVESCPMKDGPLITDLMKLPVYVTYRYYRWCIVIGIGNNITDTENQKKVLSLLPPQILAPIGQHFYQEHKSTQK